MQSDQTPELRSGEKQPAEYGSSTSLPQHASNPCIACLPAILNPFKDAELFATYPFLPDQLDENPAVRMHELEAALQDWYQPTSGTIELAVALDQLLRGGYLKRNPFLTPYQIGREDDLKRLQTGLVRAGCRSASLTTRFIGASGMGKTTALEKILSRYTQVIYHQEFQGRPFHFTQLVWIHMDCPFDGSPRGLCLNFLSTVDGILGTTYYSEYSRGKPNTDQLLMAMARVVRNHALGLFVIDEINVLRDIKTEGATKLLSFFVQLVNTLGVPVMSVGTCRASKLFQRAFRQARRGTGQGALTWLPFAKNQTDWTLLFNSLSRYQVMDVPITSANELTKLRNVLHEESVGIVDIAVKLWKFAQWRGLAQGHKSLSAALITSVAQDSLGEVRTLLQAFREKRLGVDGLEDIAIFDEKSLLKSAKDANEQAVFRMLCERVQKLQQQAQEKTEGNSAGTDTVKDGTVRNEQPTPQNSSVTPLEELSKSKTEPHQPSLKDIVAETARNGQSPLHGLRDYGISPLSDEGAGA